MQAGMRIWGTPLALFALPAILLYAGGSEAWLLRPDTLTSGELWRLWTGHWVHFSPAHAGWNLLVLLMAGAGLERSQPGLLLRHVLAAAPLLSLAILMREPAFSGYGGLSGLATGVVVLLAIEELPAPGARRWLWAGVLVLAIAKSIHDLGGIALTSATSNAPFRLSPVAHGAGAALGAAHALGRAFLRKTKSWRTQAAG
jgi:rhomboid family GlyGly-CTERM serine protease